MEALRDFTDVQIMTKGVAVAGRVVDRSTSGRGRRGRPDRVQHGRGLPFRYAADDHRRERRVPLLSRPARPFEPPGEGEGTRAGSAGDRGEGWYGAGRDPLGPPRTIAGRVVDSRGSRSPGRSSPSTAGAAPGPSESTSSPMPRAGSAGTMRRPIPSCSMPAAPASRSSCGNGSPPRTARSFWSSGGRCPSRVGSGTPRRKPIDRADVEIGVA